MSEQEQVDWQKVSESLTAWVSTVSEQLRAAFQQMLPVMQSISIERIQQHHEMLISAHELGEQIRARREQEEASSD